MALLSNATFLERNGGLTLSSWRQRNGESHNTPPWCWRVDVRKDVASVFWQKSWPTSAGETAASTGALRLELSASGTGCAAAVRVRSWLRLLARGLQDPTAPLFPSLQDCYTIRLTRANWLALVFLSAQRSPRRPLYGHVTMPEQQPAQSSKGTIASRRSHRKSRLGCQNCKKRRIKVSLFRYIVLPFPRHRVERSSGWGRYCFPETFAFGRLHALLTHAYLTDREFLMLCSATRKSPSAQIASGMPFNVTLT